MNPYFSYFRSIIKFDIIFGKLKQKSWSISTPKKLGIDAIKAP